MNGGSPCLIGELVRLKLIWNGGGGEDNCLRVVGILARLLLLVLILGSLVFELGTALFAGLVEVELVKLVYGRDGLIEVF